MRYIKVLLLAVVFFLALVFFFQNQGALSQSMVLTLNLFFIPAMSSIALPFYFLVIAAFACGALMTLGFLVWDKVSLTARLMKQKWQIGSLERELEKTKKKLGADTARAQFLSKNGKPETPPAVAAAAATTATAAAEETLAPDPDKQQ